jgi:hypothetical protein
MSTLLVSIPDSVRARIEEFAREDGVSVDAFVASILSQRVAVAEADSYVRRRAGRGSAEQLLDILDKAPDVEPEPHDRITPTANKALE